MLFEFCKPSLLYINYQKQLIFLDSPQSFREYSPVVFAYDRHNLQYAPGHITKINEYTDEKISRIQSRQFLKLPKEHMRRH